MWFFPKVKEKGHATRPVKKKTLIKSILACQVKSIVVRPSLHLLFTIKSPRKKTNLEIKVPRRQQIQSALNAAPDQVCHTAGGFRTEWMMFTQGSAEVVFWDTGCRTIGGRLVFLVKQPIRVTSIGCRKGHGECVDTSPGSYSAKDHRLGRACEISY